MMGKLDPNQKFQCLIVAAVMLWISFYIMNYQPAATLLGLLTLSIAALSGLIVILEGTEPVETPLSQIEIVEVFEYHDEPLLVSGRGNDGKFYLGVMIKDESLTQVWMYAELDEFQQKALALNVLPLRKTFTHNPNDYVLVVRKLSSTDKNIISPLKIRVSALTEDMLPTKDSGNV